MKAGETLVVLGASGGVGLAAVEIGALMGARVVACASSDEKLAFVRRFGANETINYATQDLRAELKRLGGAGGVDVVYDPVGGALTELALRSLGWKGRLLVIGFASGEIPKPPLNLVLLKGCDIRGVFWGDFIAREPQVHRANMAALPRLCRPRGDLGPCPCGLSARNPSSSAFGADRSRSRSARQGVAEDGGRIAARLPCTSDGSGMRITCAGRHMFESAPGRRRGIEEGWSR